MKFLPAGDFNWHCRSGVAFTAPLRDDQDKHLKSLEITVRYLIFPKVVCQPEENEKVMVMNSVKASAKEWKFTGLRLVALMCIVAQAFGPATVWPQQPAPPRFDKEIAKQEKIYRSQGAEVPSGYVTSRALSDYVEILSSSFCDTLAKLGASDRWLDIGAGDGQAILDYYAFDNAAPVENCPRSWSTARAVALSIEDRRTAKWRQQAAIFGADRMRYLTGKRLRQYTPEELGKFQIITDVYGGFSYTEDLSQFLEKVLGLLESGGIFYTLVQGVHLENGKDKPGSFYQTELMDASGRQETVCSWLQKITCARVGCESKSDWDSPTEVISVRKICSDVSVPRLKLLTYEAGNPPSRRFQLEP